MKVLLICNSDAALYRFRRPILSKLKEEKCHIVTISSDTGYKDKLSKIVSKAYNINMYKKENIFNVFTSILNAISISKKEKPNIIHGFTHFGNIISFFAKVANPRAKLILSITGMGRVFGDNRYGLKNKILSFSILSFYKMASYLSSKIIVQNNDDYLLLSKYVDNNKLVIQGGSGIEIKSNITRDKVGDVIKILMASRTEVEKGYYEFFLAAKFINSLSISNNYEFIFCGGKSLSEPFDEEIEKLASESGVNYLGYVLNVEKYISECSVMVLPSYYREGVPRSLIEGLYFDKYIITTDNPGCKETVINNWNGLLVDKKNVNSLISAFLSLNPEKINSSIGRSSHLCEFKFNGKNIADETYSFYISD